MISGEVGRVGGIRVVVSHLLTSDMNASGVYDNTTKTKSGVLLVNRSRWQFGRRRGPVVQMDADITRGIHNIVCPVREVLWSLDASTKVNVVYGYNL